MMSRKVALVLFVAWLATAQGYPQFWEEEYAPNCNALPTKGAHCHKAPQEDKATTITVTDGAGKAVTTVCPNKEYTIRVNFPDARYVFVTSNGGRVKVQNAGNKRCNNAMVFSKKTGLSAPSKSVSGPASAPASGNWQISVSSATGECAPFLNTRATLPVGKC